MQDQVRRSDFIWNALGSQSFKQKWHDPSKMFVEVNWVEFRIRILKRNRANSVCVCMIYYKVFARELLREKSYDLRSAVCKLKAQESWLYSLKGWELESWWCRFWSGSEGMRTRSAKGRRRSMSQLSCQAENKFNLPLPFCSIHALNGLDDAHPHWEGHLANLVHLFKC